MDVNSNMKESSLKCALCKHHCQEPKVLPCLHSCCASCITSVTSSIASLRCRICLEFVDASTVSDFPDNFWFKKLQLADEEESPLQVPSKGMRKEAKRKMCKKHSKEELRYFCLTCEETMCSECLLSKHRRHEFGKVEEYAEKYRSKLAMLEVLARERLKPTKASLQQIHHLQQSLLHNASSAKQSVSNEFQKLKERLLVAEKEMIREIEKECKRKALILREQEKDLKLVAEKWSAACEFLIKTVSHTDDVEITLIRKRIEDRMKNLKEIEIKEEPQCDGEIGKGGVKGKVKAILES